MSARDRRSIPGNSILRDSEIGADTVTGMLTCLCRDHVILAFRTDQSRWYQTGRCGAALQRTVALRVGITGYGRHFICLSGSCEREVDIYMPGVDNTTDISIRTLLRRWQNMGVTIYETDVNDTTVATAYPRIYESVQEAVQGSPLEEEYNER